VADPARPAVVVRPAEERDVRAIARLNRLVQALHAEAEPAFFRPPEDMPGLEAFHQVGLGAEGRTTLVAEVGPEVVGYVALVLQDRGAHTFAWAHRRLYVDQVGVDPAHRRSGVGRALMAAVEEQARALSVGEVALDTWAFNEEAQAFFRALGYGVYNLRLRKDVPGAP
jgi:ribosomal protein S18 acetylase RimI-like enzyme